MKKYLFLDIDGVLNHEEWYAKIIVGKMPPELSWPVCDFDPECVARVNKILKETGAVLVISSTWRIAEELPEIFERVGLPKEYKVTPKLLGQPRGLEIRHFLDNEGVPLGGGTYAIIDDDNDMLPLQKEHFFQTASCEYDDPYTENGGTGLTEKLADNIIKHLNEWQQ